LGTQVCRETVRFPGPLSGIGIKRGRSMWTGDIREVYWLRDNSVAPLVPASRYPEWATVCPYGSSFLALGRDDTLCLWGNPEDDHYFFFNPNGVDPRRLLLSSRIHAREIADLAP